MRERWIVISNCQSFGLANSISAVARSIDCDACDVWQMRDLLAKDPDHFRRYDLALVLPEARDFETFPSDDALPPSITVPAFMFGGYHPDSCYVFADGESVHDGFIGPYHSMIALAAFKEELSPAETVRWFNDGLYRAAGYHQHWNAHRDHMVEFFGNHGLKIAPLFRKLGKGRCFMHTTDHPKIEVLVEIARAILNRLDRPAYGDVLLPADNLAATSWPIYPEIGAELGLKGDYQFRRAHQYAAIGLEDYLEQAFAVFGRWHKSQLRVIPGTQRLLQAIRRIIREGS